jgi:hypothetical protein
MLSALRGLREVATAIHDDRRATTMLCPMREFALSSLTDFLGREDARRLEQRIEHVSSLRQATDRSCPAMHGGTTPGSAQAY